MITQSSIKKIDFFTFLNKFNNLQRFKTTAICFLKIFFMNCDSPNGRKCFMTVTHCRNSTCGQL